MKTRKLRRQGDKTSNNQRIFENSDTTIQEYKKLKNTKMQ